jgi:hypothetical protein
LLAVTLSSCNGPFDAPNQNAGTLQDLTATPTRVGVLTATQGLLTLSRLSFGFNALTLGIFGREGYNLDVSNPQNIPNYYTVLGDLTAGVWTNAYRAFEQANLVTGALDRVADMTAAEREGVRGFAQTMKALNLLYVIRGTDSSGAVLEVLSDPTAPPPNIVTKGQVYARIFQLLDSAQTHLQNGGSAFAFRLGGGFAGFSTPAGFLKFNRAIRAKLDVETGDYVTALTDLAASFVDTTAAFSVGIYYTFSTTSGDAQNTLYDPTARQLYAHASYATDAQLQTGGAKDNRFVTKIRAIPAFTRYGFSVAWTFQRYNSPSDPVPIIRNEELILLRAEANVGLGNTAAAIADINVVRTKSGLLPPISNPYVPVGTQPPTLLDELLYEKRYSLVWENGDRWVDLRHYGKLATLPKDRTGDLIFPYLRIPVNECRPRTPAPWGCAAATGL